MGRRKRTPTKTESDVLTASARRCCVCFGIDGDFSEKEGQITHLDHDPSNCKFDNLAWMCLRHHDRYDSKTIMSVQFKASDINPKTKGLDNVPITAYAPYDTFSNILESTRRELTRHLVAMLSRTQGKV